MEYLNLYNAIIVVNILPVILLFSIMWIYEKDDVLKIWLIGISICTVSIMWGAESSSKLIYLIGGIIYYIGEGISLVGCFNLIRQRTSRKKEIYNMQKVFLRSIMIALMLIGITGWSMQIMAVFFGVWYLIVAFVAIKYYQLHNLNKIILGCAFLLHGCMLVGVSLLTGSSALKLIVSSIYSMTYGLLGMSIILFYYQTRSKEACESLSLTDEIIQNVPIILEKVDCEGNVMYSNKRFKSILGYKEEWEQLSQMKDYMHQKEYHLIDKILESLKPNGGSAQFQFRLKHYKGYYIWVGLDVNPILNEAGRKIGNIVCCRDMTTEKITYMDLLKSQRKFYQVFQGTQDAVFIMPFSEAYAYTSFNEFNKAACENFGYEEEVYKEMCLADLDMRFLRDKKMQQDQTSIQSLSKEDKVIYETEYCTKAGKLIPVEVVEYKFTLNNKEMVMAVVRDISERNMVKEVKALEKIKSDFLANIAHELRTPLNVVMITLQSMELYINDLCSALGTTDEKGKRYVEIMEQNALRLLKLVNNFLCMAKIESGYYESNMQKYNIVSLVEDISDSVLTYIQDHGISFEFDTDVEEKVVSCDVEMIEKIMLNLISNAVKFTRPGGRLAIHIKDKGNKVQIIVMDSGRGIPKSKQKVIFERFRQADKTFTRKQEGCGIGLYLVKCFVKEHGGTIELESEVGVGTKILIELPAFIEKDMPYIRYNFNVEEDTLYRRALEFSDIIHRKCKAN